MYYFITTRCFFFRVLIITVSYCEFQNKFQKGQDIASLRTVFVNRQSLVEVIKVDQFQTDYIFERHRPCKNKKKLRKTIAVLEEIKFDSAVVIVEVNLLHELTCLMVTFAIDFFLNTHILFELLRLRRIITYKFNFFF